MEKKKLAGVLIGNINTEHSHKILTGIYIGFSGKNTDCVYFVGTEAASISAGYGRNYDYQYRYLYDYANYLDLDVLIVVYSSLSLLQETHDIGEFLKGLPDVPKIVIESDYQAEKVISLSFDNYDAEYRMTDYLLRKKGKRCPVFLSGPIHNYEVRERLRGFKKAAADNGLHITDENVGYGNLSVFVENEVADLFQKNPDADAIICANDEMASTVCRMMKERGVLPGKEVVVTGFDNESFAGMMNPGLTTVDQDEITIGRLAAEAAVRLMAGEEIKSMSLKGKLIFRDSTEGGGLPDAGILKEIRETDFLTNLAKKGREIEEYSLRGPEFLRELIHNITDEETFYKKIMEELSFFQAESSKLFLLKEAAVKKKESTHRISGELVLAAEQEGMTVDVYGKKGPSFSRQKLLRFEDREKGPSQYMTYLLYDGNIQYGVLLTEIRPEETGKYNNISLQIGTGLRFLELFLSELQERVTIQRQNALLHNEANTDSMTGVFNRRGFYELWDKSFSNNIGMRMIFLMSDLDHLKEINDTFGHEAGDTAIREEVKLLKIALGNSAVIARFGGDEFVAMFSPAAYMDLDYLSRKIEKIMKKENGKYPDRRYYTEISYGILDLTISDQTLEGILPLLDARLYENKKSRRKSVKKE